MKPVLVLLALLMLAACEAPEVVINPKGGDKVCVVKYESATLSMYAPTIGVEDIEDVSLEVAEEVTALVGLCN